MKKLFSLFVFTFILAINVDAQPFKNQSVLKGRPTDKKVTFWDVEKAFNEFWENKKVSENESENAEEGGWQQFKRWEWFTKQRTFPSGVFQNPDILFNEY